MSETSAYLDFYHQTDDLRRVGRREMPEALRVTLDWLGRTGHDRPDALVVELGCGMGPLSGAHPNYLGLDFSLSGLRQFPPGRRRVNGDMQRLPFRDASVDFVFSWAALEHVPDPGRALAEIERVLTPGGVALLAPAWNVRSWAAKGLPIKSYAELGWLDRLAKASIPVRNSLAWRALFALPRRLLLELFRRASPRPLPFFRKQLKPNLREFVYTDCDAFTSMDPHAAILYFESRAWEVLSHPTLSARLRSRHEPVVVRKPGAAASRRRAA